MFGWSSISYGVSTSQTESSWRGTFKDWGNNEISNGGNVASQWQTLSRAEWDYLYLTRTNASSLHFNATVNGVKGGVFLPDNWAKGSFVYTTGVYDYTTNTYTTAEWKAFEAAGAVFLPCAGDRTGTSVQGVNARAQYWTSTTDSETDTYAYYLNAGNGSQGGSCPRYYGRSVRLVRIVE